MSIQSFVLAQSHLVWYNPLIRLMYMGFVQQFVEDFKSNFVGSNGLFLSLFFDELAPKL